jgi:hypothetical protein
MSDDPSDSNGSSSNSDDSSSISSDSSANSISTDFPVSGPDPVVMQRSHEMLTQFVYEAVRGHTAATRAVDRCFECAAHGNPRQRLD